MELLDAVRESLLTCGMLSGADTVISAFSGGADSLCLTDVLLTLAPELGFRVECAHYNHMLRGEESRRDERFVTEWCASRTVKLHIGRGDAAAYAAEHHMGIEEAARSMRYSFLETLGDEKTRIATAHQADDQAETVLLNLLRGSGLKGLGGIPPVRGRFIRPMLGATREQIREYLKQNGSTWMEDSSNQNTDFRRNKLRNQVMPILRELNPDFAGTCFRTSRLLRADEDFLAGLAAKAVTVEGETAVMSVPELLSLPEPLSSRALRQAAGVFGVQPEEKHISALMVLAASGDPSACMDLPGGVTARRQYDRLLIAGRIPTVSVPNVELTYGAWTEIPELSLRVFWGEKTEAEKIHGKFTTYFFKKAQICGSMNVRSRREGDRLQPPGRQGKSLKKWMIQEKIPAAERERVPVFADNAGVVAVRGIGADARAAVPEASADSVLVIMERT